MVRIVVLAAVLAGAAVVAIVLASDHQDAQVAWAIFGPVVGWSFVGTGLYAWRRRPESRIGMLMVALGFAWFFSMLEHANAPLPYTVGLACAGLWGGVLLHIGLSFPSGRLTSRRDRLLVLAGYPVITFGLVPALLFAGPSELGCDDCPENLLLIDRDPDLASAGMALGVVLYALLLIAVLVRTSGRLRSAGPEERLQLIPVYAFALLTFVLVTVARAGAGDAAWWAAIVSTALVPYAFLGSLLRSHVSHLDAELRESLEELRASRARLVQAGDAERRRLERDLHDGAQSRLVALALLLRTARTRAADDAELAAMLDSRPGGAADEPGRAARAGPRHPPGGADRAGLEPALHALVARAPVPVDVEADAGGAPPDPGRERRVLRRLRGARQRREVRARHAGQRDRAAPRRARERGRRGRRRRRGGRRARHGAARARRPRGRARRHARAREPGGPRHAPARRDPALTGDGGGAPQSRRRARA